MNHSLMIKAEAARLGFDACGIAEAGYVNEHALYLREQLDKKYHAGMKYMDNHFNKRCDPRLLVENAKSVIVVALNYYPEKKQNKTLPQIAFYAYGKDYHPIIKEKLRQLLAFINEHIAPASGRYFTDSAPVLERYWATQAGIGFIGKNNNLIIPQKGSYFFLGELIIDLPLSHDNAITRNRCGKCTRCVDACPTGALEKPFCLNVEKCISYLTIENKNDIDEELRPLMNNRFFGCDICQQVCPWNKFSEPHTHPELNPVEELLDKSSEEWMSTSDEEFLKQAKDSPLLRTGLKNLKRNLGIKQE
jgi:epoxyqueuosine reductase